MNISLQGKAALVTGAGRGIGFAIAELLCQAGAAVLLVDVDQTALSSAGQRLSQSGKAIAMVVDLTAAGAADRVFEKLISEFGGWDILVNNAGYTWDSVIQKTSDEQFQAMLDIHIVAPFRVLRAASNWLRATAKQEAETGKPLVRKVVNITSISGLDGNAGQVGYSSGKSAVVGLTKTLAKEWGRYNVNVNAVGFGLIDTRLTKPMQHQETKILVGDRNLQVGMQERVREEASKMIPLGRVGTTTDAANAVFFFCSHLSDYVTGEVLICGGGLHF